MSDALKRLYEAADRVCAPIREQDCRLAERQAEWGKCFLCQKPTDPVDCGLCTACRGPY